MVMRWTEQDIQKLAARGMVKVAGNSNKVAQNANKVADPVKKLPKNAMKEPKALTEIKQKLELLHIPYQVEYRFHDKRKFRFDIAIVENKIGIEFEGLISEKSRHITIGGYSKDCEKYNLAQLSGWIVLRYTVLSYEQCISDILSLINP